MDSWATIPFLISLICNTVLAFPAPRVGDKAPEFSFNQLVHSPAGPVGNLEALQGRVVVLFFWQSWSEACQSAARHLDKVASTLGNKPVVFYAISSEEEAALRTALKELAPSMWVWLDPDRSMLSAYSARPIPHVVLIDRDSKIAAITRPENVTAEVLEQLIEGKSIDLPLKPSEAIDSDEQVREAARPPAPLMELVIGPSKLPPNKAKYRLSDDKTRLTMDGAQLPFIVAVANRMSPHQVRMTFAPPMETYRVLIQVPHGAEDRLFPTLRSSINNVFGISVSRELVPSDGFALRRKKESDKMPAVSRASQRGAGFGGGWLRATQTTMPMLARTIESMCGCPVEDRTNLEGEFDITLRFNEGPSCAEKLNPELEKIGLRLEAKKTSLPALIIEKKQKRKSRASD